jgi:hypothetical protein
MTTRLLIIALDGADGRTLDQASRDGMLPNLTALRARGRAWTLSSAQGVTDDALWASFQYGVDVGEHGRYAYDLPRNSGQPDAAFRRELDRDTFWDKLSRQGLRVAVLDVPKCRPPRQLNGIHLADWLSHGRYFHSPRGYPETLVDDILTRFGAAPPSRCGYRPPALSDDEVQVVRENLLHAVGQKRDAGLYFLSAEPWDLFIIGFKEAHCGCHMFWEFADPKHAKYDAARVARLGNPVLDVLKKQDAAIGDLVKLVGPGANVVVFSSSDFAPNGSIQHLMPEVLERVNRYIGRRASERILQLAPDIVERGNRYIRTRTGERIVRVLRRLCRRVTPSPVLSVPYSDNASALRVARRREDSVESYAQRLDLITALVRELVDVDDGLPVVKAVTRPALEHVGERAVSLPHLVVHFRNNICSRAVTSARLGRIEASRPDNIRSGSHEAGGFAIAVGPAASDAMAQVNSMQDFAALVTKVLVVPEQKPAAIR